MSKYRLCFFFGIFLIFFINFSSAFDNSISYYSHDDVLLVCNPASSESLEICSYFISKRPTLHHVLNLSNIPNNEIINCTIYNSIEQQIKQYLNYNEGINYITTTKGVPLGVDCSNPPFYKRSVDSLLSWNITKTNAYTNQYNHYVGEEHVFSSVKEEFYIVTRLTGYTVEDVKAIIDNSGIYVAEQDVFLDGVFVIDETNYEGIYSNYFLQTKTLLENRGYNLIYLNASHPLGFLREAENVIGYGGWGSNDRSYSQPILNNWNFISWTSPEAPSGWNIVSGEIKKANFTSSPEYANSSTAGFINQSGIFEIEQFYESSTVAKRRFYYLLNYAYRNFTGNVSIGFSSLDADNNILSSYNYSLLSTKTALSVVSLQISSLLRYYPKQNASKIKVFLIVQLGAGEFYLDNLDIREIAPTFSWKNGAIGTTAVSTSARSFSNTTSYGQSLIADLIYNGISGVEGFVYEPGLGAVANTAILFDRYTKGYNLGDSFYMASDNRNWMDVVVGDPKTVIVWGKNLSGIISAPRDFNISVINLSNNLISLSWNDTSYNEEGFIIEQATSENGPWSEFVRIGIDEKSYSILETAPTSYYYRVKAFNNSFGDSFPSYPLIPVYASPKLNVSSCRVLNNPNSVYTQVNNIVSTDPNPCIRIIASNITFDGSKYLISTYAASGVYASNVVNAVVMNSVIERNENAVGTNTTGIYFSSTNEAKIINNIIRIMNGGFSNSGIILIRSNNSLIKDNNISTSGRDNSLYGIYLASYSNNNSITGNIISTNGTSNNVGIFLTTSVNFNTIAFNNIFTFGLKSGNYGISLSIYSNNNVISFNTISTNGADSNHGIFVRVSDNNSIINNKISTNGLKDSNGGIYLTNSRYNIISYNDISTNGTNNSFGVNFIASQNNTLSFNKISTSGTKSDALTFSTYTVFKNITFYTGSNNLISNTLLNVSGLDLNISSLNINDTLLNNQPIRSYFIGGVAGGGTVYFRNSSTGEIRFAEAIYGSGSNLFGNNASDIRINYNLAYINSDQVGLNKKANITLYNLPKTIINAEILANGAICNSTTTLSCFNLSSLDAGNVSFMINIGGEYSLNYTFFERCEDLSYNQCPVFCEKIKPSVECSIPCTVYSNGTVSCPDISQCAGTQWPQCLTLNPSNPSNRKNELPLAEESPIYEIDSCRVISRPGMYTLKQDLNGFSINESYCINITSSDVHLNCNKNSISEVAGGNIGIAVESPSLDSIKNITIRNCVIRTKPSTNIEKYNIAILFNRVKESSIINNDISFNKVGIKLEGNSSKNLIKSNDVSNSTFGIYLLESHNNQILKNYLDRNNVGIYVFLSNGNKLSDNTAKNSFKSNFLFVKAHNNLINKNLVEFSIGDGIHFTSSNYNNINANRIFNNSLFGIRDNLGEDNSYKNNHISNNSLEGIVLISTSNNNLRNIIVDYNGGGIKLSNSSDNYIRGKSNLNGKHGLSLTSRSNYNNIKITLENNGIAPLFDDGTNIKNKIVIG
ncbi:MAG: right-handed parallel beta-helix repeat-containing protein [Nanoarchaeota archaeon]